MTSFLLLLTGAIFAALAIYFNSPVLVPFVVVCAITAAFTFEDTYLSED